MNSLDLLAAMMGWPYYPRNSKSDFKELLSEFDWKLRTELFVFPCGISLFVCELDFEAVHNTRKNDSRSDPPSDDASYALLRSRDTRKEDLWTSK